MPRNYKRVWVPDPLAGRGRGQHHEPCGAQGEAFICTRRRGHTGRHAASNGSHIVAVWDD
jgi:hypothetical protein